MGYQALLFCPDEKLARVVAQVFTELEFNVETVQEPFSAVKKLMAQRYAALVVDCENESNASLLFKSARNSSSNQGILAIAVVEGQAGVAKAYRIGANLVLTKPINVEQAKGTLRVARGLLRKSSEGGSAAASQSPNASPRADAALAPATRTTVTEIRSSLPPLVSPSAARDVVQAEPTQPAIAASAADATVPEPLVQEAPSTDAAAAEVPATLHAEVNAVPRVIPAMQPVLTAAISTGAGATAGQGTAAAPAKVKESIPTEEKAAELEPVESRHVVFPAQGAEAMENAPLFSGVEPESSSTSGGNKKVLIAAALLLAIAALGYFGWTKFGPHGTEGTPAQPVNTLRPSAPAPAPERPAMEALKAESQQPTMSQPAAAPATVVSSEGKANKNSAPTTTPRIELDTPAETKAPGVAPLVVKSKPNKQARTTSEDAPVPSPLGVGDTDSSTLNNLVASSGKSAPQLSLATLKLSQGVSQGLLIKRVDPKYPASALAMHVQGSVLLDATINREGQISNLKVVKGDQVLSRAATDAVKQWRYKPYYLDGQPVEIETQITVNFKLPN